MQTIEIDPRDLNTVQAILRLHVPGRVVWAFGSRVNCIAKPFSDLDLAIVDREPLPASVLADLKEAFSESDLPFKVDLVDWATTSPSFRQIIEQKHVVLSQ